MALDPTVSLALAVHSAPGVYAVLLGSGVSRSAGVPTGWDVVGDLVTQLAAASGDNLEDPFEWYRANVGDPDYSDLLEAVGPAPGDRHAILRAYFQPSAEDRDAGLKVPTAAHRSIASLVAGGWVKVIVTTNFDRLMEEALAEVGVTPVVVANAAQAAGMTPLAHNQCSVIKVHGDHLNPDIRNTAGELDRYEPDLDRLLDQVFDTYGLIVCGWSADWDPALRAAIARTPSRRYGTYWSHLDELGEHAADIVALRGAVTVPITGADDFFDNLAAKVEALVELRREPLSDELAVAELKRFIPDPTHRLRLYDLVVGETDTLGPLWERPTNQSSIEIDELAELMRETSDACARLVSLLSTLAYFADDERHDRAITETMLRLASRPTDPGGRLTVLNGLQWYPAMLATYAVGTCALAAGRLAPLERFALTEVGRPGDLSPFVVHAASWHLAERSANILLKEQTGSESRVAQSQLLHLVLREPLRHIFPDDGAFDRAFDRFEALLDTLIVLNNHGRAPIGRFAFEHRSSAIDRILDTHETWLRDHTHDGADFDALLAEYRQHVDRIW